LLAAGMGTRLAPLTDGRPKCMVPLHGKPLLHWQLAAAKKAGISAVTLVGGYKAEQLEPFGRVVRNPDFETTNMVESLWRAKDALKHGALICYGDILCAPRVIAAAAGAPHDVAVAVDSKWKEYWTARFGDPLKDAESLAMDEAGRLRSIGQKVSSVDAIQAQYLGLIRLSAKGAKILVDAYTAKRADPKARKMFMTDLLQGAIDAGVPVQSVPVSGGWLEIDSRSDLELAEKSTRVSGETLDILR
jgi:L-glutamine-phosphate cytidylyltransferase